MQIRLLGGVAAFTDQGELVDLGPAKCRALLAALALSAGQAVPVWRLVELVWGADPPRTADRTLQSYVTGLRRSLGAEVIVRTGSAYRLDLAADAVDALRFQHRIEAGDHAAALAEWTGLPLAGLEAPGLTAIVEGLHERWLVAMLADLQARVETDPAATLGPLTELTTNYPFQEGFWALLMTALYRVGRQGEALTAYRTARRNLLEQLGVEPGPRLRELESLVLSHDDRLIGSPNSLQVRGNLPARPGRLIGRDGDLGLIDLALTGHPVVTLVGPGGIGKTRLAVAAAQRAAAPDGAWLVDLTEITSSSDVPRAVAGVLEIKESRGRSLAASIVAALYNRRALLVLDNCEHVIEGAAELAEAIAEGCPGTVVLATSREGLGLRHGHERLIAVTGLEPAGPGAELFNERAAAAANSFDPTADRQEVEEICRRLDGVPLAIELAAARTTSLTPAELLDRLDDHLRLLSGGRRTGAGRHRTMRATIEWSFNLLSAAEQIFLQRLSIFTGPFDRMAAESVAADPGLDDPDRLLGDLVDRSLVVVEPGPFGRRFRLLESLRQFAAEQLAKSGDGDLIADRHARWCLHRVTRIHRLLSGLGEVEGVARLDELWPNQRAAFGWACRIGDRPLALALIRPIVAEIAFRNRSEIADWVERLLALTPPADGELVVLGLTWAAQRYKMTQDVKAFELLVDRFGAPDHPLIQHARASVHEDYDAVARAAPGCLAELRRRGDDDLAEQIEVDIGAAAVFCGRFAEGEARLGELARRYRAQGPPTLLNWALMMLGYAALFQNEQERADRCFEQAIAVQVPERTHSPNKPVQARTLFRKGEQEAAFRILGTHVEELLAADNMYAACVTAVEFINMMTGIGRLEEAAIALAYLDSGELLESTTWATQVADARTAIEAVAGSRARPAALLDDRQLLNYMAGILSEAPKAP